MQLRLQMSASQMGKSKPKVWRDNSPKVSQGYNVAMLSDEETAGKYGEMLDAIVTEEKTWKKSTTKSAENTTTSPRRC